MNGDMLSQDEIDALLNAGSSGEEQNTPEPSADISDFLTEIEQDALGEIGNISFGSSATALSTLLGQKVEITTPTVSIIERDKLEDEFPHPYVAIQVQYTDGFSGVNILVIKQSDAAIIADLMLGGDGTSPDMNMDEIHLSAVQEAMNQMMGSAATSMSAVFNKRVDISPPSINFLNVSDDEGTEQIPRTDLLVRVSFRLKIGTLIDSNIMQVLPVDFAKDMVDQLMNPAEPEPASPPPSQSAPEPSYRPAPEQPAYSAPEPARQPAPEPVRQAAPTNVQPASFSEFQQAPVQSTDTRNLDMLLDIPLQVTVELGRARRSVKEILDLGAGSIIELDKLAGEPVDILVNKQLVAKGEVVVIDENFGVRVTEIASQSDRLKKLK